MSNQNNKGSAGISKLTQGSSLDEQEKLKCAVCGNEAEKRCGNCRLVNYCSAQHQKDHWKEHKKVCSPFIVKHSEELGRYLIASRDLPGKSLIIKESPFAFAPYDQVGGHVPMCLGCCLRMSNMPDRRCSSCQWPVCSTQCEEMSTHRNYECGILTEKKVSYPPPKEDATFSSILILRLFLQRDKCPSLWRDFLVMEHHTKKRMEKERCNNDDMLILENLREYLDHLIDEEEIRQVIGRVSVNSFGVTRREDGKNDDTVGRGVYLKTGIVAHGCIPNAVWGISYSPKFEIIVRAAVPIKKGELITPSYSDIWNSLGTYPRLVTMLERSHFICTCHRCSDPTELGTFLSAISCPKCKQGYLLPLNPLNLEGNARWQCGHCRGGDVQRTIVSLVEDLEYEAEQKITEVASNEKTRAGLLEDEYKRLVETLLHSNHYVVRNLERAIVTKLYPLLRSCSFEELNSFIFHCENLLRVTDILSPGYTGNGGILRNSLCDGLIQLKTKAVKEGCVSTVFKSTQAFEDHIRRIDKLKEEAAAHLENDPDSTPVTGGRGGRRK